MEFIVAAADPRHREALQTALQASGHESGAEIASAEQLQRLLEGRLESPDGIATDLVLVVADEVNERAQFLAPALGSGVPVLIWPVRTAPHSLELAGAAGERGSAGRGAARLTPRERQVLALVAAGVPNKGIARSLGVSPNTVKFHLSSLFDKLGVGSRAEAIAAAARAGEIAL